MKRFIPLLCLCIVIGALIACGESTTSTSNGTKQAPAKQGTWQTTHTYTGNGAKKTESFTVGNDWKIQWSCNPGSIGMDAPLFIMVDKTDGSIFDPGVNTTCKNGQDTTGETQEHQGGTFYLDVNAGISWSLTIQELK